MTSFEKIKQMKRLEAKTIVSDGREFRLKRITKDYYEITSPAHRGYALGPITINDLERMCTKGIIVEVQA